jgi:acyl-CoA thioester hydrolase
MRNTSFALYHQILDDTGDLAAEGYDVVVLYNYKKGEKHPLPSELRALVENAEGQSFSTDN